jgi:prevent-host-death family protein
MSRAKPRSWQLQDAKNQFSEVVEAAVQVGPQVITRRGTETAVVLSFEEWTRMARARGPLVDLLRRAPRVTGGLATERSRDAARDVDL